MENPRIAFPDLPDVVVSVRRFRVDERMSRPFRVELSVVSAEVAIDLERLTGARAAFELEWNTVRRLFGVVETARFVRVAEDGTGLATYELSIVPSLAQLGRRVQSRLFQHRSIPEIVGALLTEHRIPHTFVLATEAYPRLELRTQYGESDLAFVSRLLEEAGISYAFVEPGEDDLAQTALGDEAPDMRVVLTDAPQGAPERAGPPLPFVESTSLVLSGKSPFITALSVESTVRPGRVTLRDHDFQRPRFAFFAGAEGALADELPAEQYRYAPGAFLEEMPRASLSPTAARTPTADDRGVARHKESRGALVAQRALEALHADRTRISFESGAVDLAPGTVFRVTGHPRPELAPTRSHLVIGSVLEGEVAAAETWRWSGVAVPTDKPFRPAQITPKPRMDGVQTATVVGPESPPADWQAQPGGVGRVNAAALDGSTAAARLVDNDIYTDEHGRVRVQFPWDREGGWSGDSSAWMRVSQGWAGRGYGLFTIPRVGHEVLVAFVGGDPDCPVIVGRLHNALEPPPFKLPDNKTVSTWRTASSPGGGGFNELRFDDALGHESVFLQAERDMDHLVKNDLRAAVGGDSTTYVQNDESVAIGRDQSVVANANTTHATGLNRSDVVGVNRTSTVGSEDSTVVGARWSVTVARGLTGHLPREIERAAKGAGSVLRSAATTVLGLLPGDPRAAASGAALADLGRRGLGKLREAVAILGGFQTEPGPPPTSIEVVDRQIKLGTGEASIVIDGPNVVITAQGNIALHALGHVSVLGEREVAVAGGEKVALVSAKDEVLVQAGANVHLNPFTASTGPAPAASIDQGAVVAERCGTCGQLLTDGPEGRYCAACRSRAAGEDEAGEGAAFAHEEVE
ncbi:MAG: type VI secretion system tip protein TssI/VgrG [Polyangiaceae bacterium]